MAALWCAANAIAVTAAAHEAAAATPQEVAELRTLVQAQASELAALRQRLDRLDQQSVATDQRVQVAEEQLDVTVSALERGTLGGASVAASWPAQTRLGGYGEMHYNDLAADAASNDLDQIDYHRFVLFLSHQFSERISLHSELELEHSLVGGGGPGEFELEQAYLEFDLGDGYRARTGLFLLPIGLLNETHEPPTFYGVERNDVESIIIPTTWWEGGVSTHASFDNGVSVDFALHSGLEMPVSGSSAFRVRSGRQKVAEASSADLAYTGRVRYSGIPGLDLSLAVQYQSDASQVSSDGLDEGWLTALAGSFQRGPFGLRALYGRWDFNGAAIEAAGADEQTGWYLEPSWRFVTGYGDAGVYIRYEDLDGARSQDQFDQWEVGVNYYPHPDVVLKFDFRDRSHDVAGAGVRDFQGIDLGLGYQF